MFPKELNREAEDLQARLTDSDRGKTSTVKPNPKQTRKTSNIDSEKELSPTKKEEEKTLLGSVSFYSPKTYRINVETARGTKRRSWN